jgi:hypothetical protein
MSLLKTSPGQVDEFFTGSLSANTLALPFNADLIIRLDYLNEVALKTKSSKTANEKITGIRYLHEDVLKTVTGSCL